ncbi:hypothetical protein, partial [Fusobacterium sp. PH5-44]|uniref:hypothetical protein n=1 Tax=unclassified Fusobacterium TaxID=2648384 RepID=UPI003D1A15C1
EGGHGTYANAIIDEKAVGALTGKIVYDQNKGIILSDELAAKVQQNTMQYFMDRTDGKLRDATGIVIVSGGISAGSVGKGITYTVGTTIFHEKYGIELFKSDSKPLTLNGTGHISPSLGINAGIGIGLYPFTTKTEDYAGEGHSYYVQASLKKFFINISVTPPTEGSWKGAGLEVAVGKDISLGGSDNLDWGVSLYNVEFSGTGKIIEINDKAKKGAAHLQYILYKQEQGMYDDSDDGDDEFYNDLNGY